MDVGERAETSGGKAVAPERKEKFPIGEMGRATMPLKADGRNDLTSRVQVQTGLIVVWRKEIICGAADYGACMAAGLEPQFIFLPDEADSLEFVLSQAEKSTKWQMT